MRAGQRKIRKALRIDERERADAGGNADQARHDYGEPRSSHPRIYIGLECQLNTLSGSA